MKRVSTVAYVTAKYSLIVGIAFAYGYLALLCIALAGD